MANLFYMGGPLFMGILTALLVVILAMAVWFSLAVVSGRAREMEHFPHRLSYLKSLGLFTMITGILGQLIGLLLAFRAIEEASDISPAIVAGGLKVSMITTLYGIGVYLFSILLWLGLDLWYHQNARS